MKYSFDISNFLEEISSLTLSIVFLYFFALFIEEGLLASLAILWNSTFNRVYLSLSPLLFTSLLSSAICKASSGNHFAYLHFLFFGMVLFAATCTILWTLSIVLQTLFLLDLIPWIYSSPPLYICRRFDLTCTWLA